MTTQTIGFIGAGQMARALAGGFVSSGLLDGKQLWAHDPHRAAVAEFCRTVAGATVAKNNVELTETADVVFLAIKPQRVEVVMDELADADTEGRLFVSIVAGVTLARLSRGLRSQRVIRVMPNTPCLIGKGAAAYSLGPAATQADGQLVRQLFESVACVEVLPESQLDTVTGLSGSGPAYVYQLIEALSDGAVHMGLPREVATRLAAATVAGAGEMVQMTGEHPAVLKDRVTSPGGTTIAGLEALERHGMRSAVMAAVAAATRRSKALGDAAAD